MTVTYKRVKYLVAGVIAELDEDGNIIGEQQTQSMAVYTPEQLQEFVARVDQDVDAANAESMNGADPAAQEVVTE